MNKRIRINGNLYEAVSPRRRSRRMNEAAVAKQETINVKNGWRATVFAGEDGDAYNKELGIRVSVKFDDPDNQVSYDDPMPVICHISSRSANIVIDFLTEDDIEDTTAKVVELVDNSINKLVDTISKNLLVVFSDYEIDELRNSLLSEITKSFRSQFSHVSKASIT